MGPWNARRIALVAVLAIALAPVARLTCAAACAGPREASVATHAHCAGAEAANGAGDARWSPEDRGACGDLHAAAWTGTAARAGIGVVLAAGRAPDPVIPVSGALHPERRPPPAAAPPGYAGHARPLRL